MSFEFTPANKVSNSNITAAFSYVLLLVFGGSGKLRNIQFDGSLDCMKYVHKYIEVRFIMTYSIAQYCELPYHSNIVVTYT